MPYKTSEKRREYSRKWRAKNREACNKHSRDYRKRNPQKTNEYHAKYRWKEKIIAYSMLDPNLICETCGENDIRVLQINHKSGGGQLRNRFNERPQVLIRNIIKSAVSTDDLNLLCANCNILWEHEVRKTRYLYLPHKPYTINDIDFKPEKEVNHTPYGCKEKKDWMEKSKRR